MSDFKCPNCGNADGNKLCGHEIRGFYDGIAYWTCWECGHRWHRFPEGSARREAVQRMWDDWDGGT
jgi:predicted RNA-binding Zn-ribbon protein involved in translation (DUF1610 family)